MSTRPSRKRTQLDYKNPVRYLTDSEAKVAAMEEEEATGKARRKKPRTTYKPRAKPKAKIDVLEAGQPDDSKPKAHAGLASGKSEAADARPEASGKSKATAAAVDSWTYIDAINTIQGPFKTATMQTWVRKGYFIPGLLCARHEPGAGYVRIDSCPELWGTIKSHDTGLASGKSKATAAVSSAPSASSPREITTKVRAVPRSMRLRRRCGCCAHST